MSEISNQLENLSFKAQQIANEASQLASSVAETSGGHSAVSYTHLTLPTT